MGQKLARPSQLISVSTGHLNVEMNALLLIGSLFHSNIIWCSPLVILNDFFICLFVLFFGQNRFGKLKLFFKIEVNKLHNIVVLSTMSLELLMHVKKVQKYI